MGRSEQQGTVLGGAAWMLGARFGERVLGLVSTAILARLLAPEDFGLVAMAMVFVAAADLLGAFGLDWALVRQKNLTCEHLDTVWTIRAGLGLAGLLALAVLSVPVAEFYRDPRIEPMLWVLGLSLFVGALENPGVVTYRRDLVFSKEFALRMIVKVTGVVVAVSVAVVLRSYWALLLGTVVGRMAGTVASYALHSHRPRLTLAKRSELMAFSGWLFVGNVLTFVRTRIVELVLGRIAGPKPLGLFAVANEISQLASTEFAAPINRALFSDYVRKVDQPGEIARSYLRAAPMIWSVALPAALGTCLVAEQIVRLLLGDQWGDAVPVLQLLAIAGGVGLLSTNAIHVYWAVGRAALESIVEGAAALTLLGAIWFLVPRVGIIGAAWAVLVANAVLAVLNAGLLSRFVGINYRETIRRSWRVFVACIVMLTVVGFWTHSWRPAAVSAALLQLLAIATVGAFVYVTTLGGLWVAAGRPAGLEVDVAMVLRERLSGRLPRRKA
jgi:PST family polysaccharide transporter